MSPMPTENPTPEAPAVKRPRSMQRELFEWSQALVGAIVSVVLAFAFLLNIFTVAQTSMLQTLHEGEMMLISRLFYTPGRGDIVVFAKAGLEVHDEENGRQSPYVKRVIGVAGDTVRIDYNQNAVYVNGLQIDEPYLWEDMRQRGSSIYEITVEPGHVFVMGDNRNGSMDSRDAAVGQIDTRFILGRLLLRLSPLSRFGPVG